MAIQSKWQLVLQIRDKGNGVTTRTYDFQDTDNAGDMSALQVDAELAIVDFHALSDCKVARYEVKKVFYDDAFTLPTLDTAETNNRLLLNAPISGNPTKSANIDVPGPKNAAFVNPNAGAGHDDCLVTAAIVTDWVNNFYANSKFFLSDGETISSDSLAGKRIHSKSRKG